MNPDPHVKVKSWEFKEAYKRKMRLGPVTHPQARKKAQVTYELMKVRG